MARHCRCSLITSSWPSDCCSLRSGPLGDFSARGNCPCRLLRLVCSPPWRSLLGKHLALARAHNGVPLLAGRRRACTLAVTIIPFAGADRAAQERRCNVGLAPQRCFCRMPGRWRSSLRPRFLRPSHLLASLANTRFCACADTTDQMKQDAVQKGTRRVSVVSDLSILSADLATFCLLVGHT